MSITVLAAGLLTSVQDLGRHGHAALGVGAAGAMDTVALRLANLLVGNVENAAALEFTLRAPRLRFDADCVIALTGAPLDGATFRAGVPMWRPLRVRAGTEIDFGAARCGVRSYLAIAGGIDSALLLGSRSTDINAALGPNGGALSTGTRLDIAALADSHAPNSGFFAAVASNSKHGADIVAAKWSIDPAPWFDADASIPIAAIRGAHFDRLEAVSQHALFAQAFRVGAQSNRVGYRLDGPRLALAAPLELVSEGVVPGVVQLPPAGEPIVLMAEAPTTGGYPRIAHVAAVDLPRLAQRRPGETIRFTEITLEDAQARHVERERALAALACTLRDRLHG